MNIAPDTHLLASIRSQRFGWKDEEKKFSVSAGQLLESLERKLLEVTA